MKARAEARKRAAAAAEARKDPDAMEALRAKFLAKVESYIGVPYGKKYHADDPTSRHHDAELYLDCCALIRRSVRDLSDEFGFVLGRGNQAYQFDTLPIRVAGVEQLKPGDLVFYASDIKVGFVGWFDPFVHPTPTQTHDIRRRFSPAVVLLFQASHQSISRRRG